jgi:hypothetical protein
MKVEKLRVNIHKLTRMKWTFPPDFVQRPFVLGSDMHRENRKSTYTQLVRSPSMEPCVSTSRPVQRHCGIVVGQQSHKEEASLKPKLQSSFQCHYLAC